MKSSTITFAAAVVLLAHGAALAQEMTLPVCERAARRFNVTLPVPPPTPVVCRLDQGCLSVDWNIAAQQNLTDTLKLYRFNETTPLRIHTTNINLLQFTVTWTQTVQQQVAGFEGATKLLEGIAPLLSLVAGGAGVLPMGGDGDVGLKFAAWVTSLELANACMQDTIGAVSDIVIDRTGTAKRLRLHETHAIITKALPELLRLRADFLDSVAGLPSPTAAEPSPTIPPSVSLTVNELEMYTKMAQRHDDFQKRAVEFLPLARNSVDGVTMVMSAEKRNSVIALTGQASKREGEKVGQAVSATYFVAWSRPVTYHVGYGYGRLKTFDFNQVRTLSGQDLFAATKPVDAAAAADTSDDSSEPEAVAFLTWELLRRGPNNRYGLGFTAGTGLESPGNSIYVGGTIRIFSRLLLTFGSVSARATRGEGAVVDTTTESRETRTLFSTLREITATKPFWSVSFKVY